MKNYDNLTDEDGSMLVRAARSMVAEYLKTGTKLSMDEKFQDDYAFNSGVFVTLSSPSGLRGCIGHPLPDKKLFNAIGDAAIAAATEDPRFPPVKPEELDSIVFEVTVLTPPERITVNEPEEYLAKVKVGRDGLIVKNGFNSGLLLPQVPVEYNWNEKEFLEHTCQKAGLPRDHWKDPETEVHKFEGVVYKEKGPNGPIVRERL